LLVCLSLSFYFLVVQLKQKKTYQQPQINACLYCMYQLAGVLYPINDPRLVFPAPIKHSVQAFHDVLSYAL